MKQTQHDDVVVEVALHSYERNFLQHGAWICHLHNFEWTPAGITGWAAASFADVKPAAAASGEAPSDGHSNGKPLLEGDKEENRMLRLAMLESTGVCFPCPVTNKGQSDHQSSSNKDMELHQYQYAKDDDGETYQYEYVDEEEDNDKDAEERSDPPDEVGSSRSLCQIPPTWSAIPFGT